MPRVSRSVSQRYANASKKKPKRRDDARGAILPPQSERAPIELPAGVASPAPLDLPSEPPPPAPPARPSGRGEARGLSRGEIRHATRRLTTAPIVDYSYVVGDLRRLSTVAALLLLVLIALTFVPALR